MLRHLVTLDGSGVLREVEQFLYREARFADTHDYDAWEALWTDDGVYWIPANGEGGDPEQVMSIVYDNRSRIALRVRQLKSGKRHSQTPRSRLSRLLSNIELIMDGEALRVHANAVVFESTARGETTWASRNEYHLRRDGGGLKMAYKKVVLINNDRALLTMSFLL